MMHRALILLFLPFPTLAADPFACVDPDIVDAFIGNPYAEPARYSTELPAEAADLPLPADLELVGSMTRGSNVTIAYKSGLDADAALSGSVESLKGAGWKEPEPDPANPFLRGFHSGSAPSTTMLCRQAEPGALSIRARNRSGHALLTFSLYRHQEGTQCAAEPLTARLLDFSLQRYIPNLEVPEGAEVRHNGGGGSNDEYSTRVVVLTTLSRDALLRHFDDQIRTQGWTADSGWSGGMTAGTVWTRNDSNDRPLVGTMRIAEASDGVFNARFTVISVTPADDFGGSSSWSTYEGGASSVQSRPISSSERDHPQ